MLKCISTKLNHWGNRSYATKKGDTNVSPVIAIYVPTLALSKSGIWVEVDDFLSACTHKLPFLYMDKV